MSGQVRIADVVIDVRDPERAAAFWSSLLDREVGGRRGPYVWLSQTGPDDIGVAFQRVDDLSSAKSRVHLDVRADDLAAAVRRVESLGGRRAAGYEDGGFLVMEDPEGNVFCIVPADGIGMDEDGRAGYLRDLQL